MVDDEEPTTRRLAGEVRPFLWVLAGVAVASLAAGLLFSQADPRGAARLMVEDAVVREPAGEATAGPAPTSGNGAGPVACGVRDASVPPDEQVAALAAGAVVVQHRDADDADVLADGLDVDSGAVLVAPNPALDARVVATAWEHRFVLDDVDLQRLRAFVTAYGGLGPEDGDCRP